MEQFFDVLFVCAVENRSCDLPIEHMRDEAEVHFEDLSNVHTGRNAEWVKHDLKRSTVSHKRHVFLWQYAGNNALIAVATRHLVADGDLSLLSDIDAHEFVYARI